MNKSAFRDWTDEPHVRALLAATGQVHFRMDAGWTRLLWLSGGGVLADQAAPAQDWLAHYIPPEDRPRVVAAVAKALRSGDAFELEHRVLRLDGSTGWLRSRAAPIRGRDGAVEEWLGAAEEISGRREAEAQLSHQKERLALALDVAALATWDWDLRTGQVIWNDGHFHLHGYTPGEVTPSYRAWSERVHPDDLPDVEAAIARAREVGADYEAEFRVLPAPGQVRWCRAKARFLRDGGEAVRMVGVMQDVTEARAIETRQRLLLSELQHRVRNALSVVRSILRRSARTAPDVDSYATHLEGRLGALARVQAAVARDPAIGVDLEAILRDELQSAAAGDAQATLDGPALRLPPGLAEMLALAFHELATNAIKHGTLARPDGHVAVTWSVAAESPARLRLRWRETGARPVPPPRHCGFGTEFLEETLAYNLRATTRLAFEGTGLIFEIDLPLPSG